VEQILIQYNYKHFDGWVDLEEYTMELWDENEIHKLHIIIPVQMELSENRKASNQGDPLHSKSDINLVTQVSSPSTPVHAVAQASHLSTLISDELSPLLPFILMCKSVVSRILSLYCHNLSKRQNYNDVGSCPHTYLVKIISMPAYVIFTANVCI